MFGIVSDPFHHRSNLTVVTTLVLLVHQMAKRSHPFFFDGASKFTGASSKSKLVGKRVVALAAVRHQKRSPFIRAQEKTQSDVKGQQNPGQPSGCRLQNPGTTGNPQVTEPGPSYLEDYYWLPKRAAECIVFIRAQRGAKSQCPSIGRLLAVHAERKRRHTKPADSVSQPESEPTDECERKSLKDFRKMGFNKLPDKYSNVFFMRR